jgi:4-amino-4-deoxy-L-arabinose transferase-like glycosyltransferase
VDHQTRVRRGRQEWLVVLCLLLAAAVAGLIYGLVTRHWVTAAMAALLVVSMGINVYGQWRRLRAIGRATREKP